MHTAGIRVCPITAGMVGVGTSYGEPVSTFFFCSSDQEPIVPFVLGRVWEKGTNPIVFLLLYIIYINFPVSFLSILWQPISTVEHSKAIKTHHMRLKRQYEFFGVIRWYILDLIIGVNGNNTC